MDKNKVEVYPEEKIDNKKHKSILYTDGVDDFWIPRKCHTREHVKNNDYKVFIPEWLAIKKGIV